jgi:hypothetical protein
VKLASLSVIALAVASAGAVRPTARTDDAGSLAASDGSLVSRGPFSTLTVLPGETVTLEGSEARPTAGRLTELGNGRWAWTAPSEPGFYPIRIIAAGKPDSVTIQAFVLVPYNRLQGESLNGYRIGRYPTRPLRGLDIYRAPAGFIEVTRENQDAFISPHFQLKQFVCKQSGGYPKYVVLNEDLVQRLEELLALANASGYRASTFHVMSGYRTPAYNRAIGNVAYSRHTWGAAADIFIDADHNGRMDDLNRDGRSDARDADVLYRLFDGVQNAGGLGRYEATAAHGPFVHVDVRDRRARW